MAVIRRRPYTFRRVPHGDLQDGLRALAQKGCQRRRGVTGDPQTVLIAQRACRLEMIMPAPRVR